jgi:purine-binding chemotaxis protein CheW
VSGVHVHLRVGAERYALPVADVRSIVDLEGLAPVLGTPAAVLGLRVLDGALLPVFDLAAALGVAGGPPTRIVVVEPRGKAEIGLAVDEVLDVADLPPLDEERAAGSLRGTALLDGVLVGAIDLGVVLDGLEAELAA